MSRDHDPPAPLTLTDIAPGCCWGELGVEHALSEAIGVLLNLIGQIECGKVAPSFRMLEGLGGALNLPVMELFRFDAES